MGRENVYLGRLVTCGIEVILEKQGVKWSTELIIAEQDLMMEMCECGNELSDSMNVAEFLPVEQL